MSFWKKGGPRKKKSEARALKGMGARLNESLPCFSVDTEEEAQSICVLVGSRQLDGTLALRKPGVFWEGTLEELDTAAAYLAWVYAEMKARSENG